MINHKVAKKNNLYLIIDKDKICKMLIITLISIIVLLNISQDFSNKALTNIIALFVMYISVYITMTYRKNIMAFCMFFMMTYFNYSIIFSRYIHVLEHLYQEFYPNIDNKTYGVGITILLVFMVSLYLVEPKLQRKLNYEEGYYFKDYSNIWVVLSCILILIYIYIFAFDKSSFGQRGATSPLYEYSGIFFIIAYYYCGKGKRLNILKIGISLLILIFCIQGFIYGERIAGLQFMLIMFAFLFSSRINYKMIIFVFAGGILFMSAIGIYRATYEAGVMSLKLVIDKLSQNMFTFGGADLAYYCSLTFIMVAEFTSGLDKFILFIKFILSIFFGTSKISGADLPTYTRQYYMHWYGGIYPYYFYFYFGWIGVIISSLFCGKIIKTIISNTIQSKSFIRILKLYIIVTLPRWYMYSPQILFRGIILFTMIYGIFQFINLLTIRRCRFISFINRGSNNE